MDLHYKQEVTVGLLVVVALIALVGGLTFLSGKQLWGSGAVTFGVRLQSVVGLGVGDPVSISGVRVGRVSDIDLESVGDVVIWLEVGRGVRPKVDARAEVRALDAFGAMFVSYDPGRAETLLQDGQMLQGVRHPPITERADVLAEQAGGVLESAGDLLSDSTEVAVRETLNAAQRAMNVVAQLGSGPLVTQATRALTRLASAAERLDSTLASDDLSRSVRQLDEITENLNDMVLGLSGATQALASIMQKIDSDSGTFGRLVNDTAAYNQIIRLTTSMQLLLDDMRERPHRYFKLSVF